MKKKDKEDKKITEDKLFEIIRDAVLNHRKASGYDIRTCTISLPSGTVAYSYLDFDDEEDFNQEDGEIEEVIINEERR